MITAWVLYYDGDRYHFQELTSSASFDRTDPTDWGLSSDCTIIATFQQASFINVWIEGERLDKWGN